MPAPDQPPPDLPARVRVLVEIPKFGLVKREGTRIEYVSPVPCPFNYGHVPGELAPDGDPPDAIVLGPRLPLGAQVDVAVHAVVRFVDAGAVDDKLVCGRPPTDRDLRGIRAFFRVYAVARAWMNRARGLPGVTRFHGIERIRR